jgi:hypothetical protein
MLPNAMSVPSVTFEEILRSKNTMEKARFVDVVDLGEFPIVPLSAFPESPPCCDATRERNYRRGYYDGWMSAYTALEETMPPDICDQLWLFLRTKLLPWKRAGSKKDPTQPYLPPSFRWFRRPGGAEAGFVYIVQAEGTPRIKIGQTRRRGMRLQQLATSSPFPLALLREIITADVRSLEKALHQRYDRYRLHGEWFELPAHVLEDLLQEVFN